MLVRGYRYTLYDVIVFSSTVCYATNGSCELGKGQKKLYAVTAADAKNCLADAS
jgi:hypothetical protein